MSTERGVGRPSKMPAPADDQAREAWLKLRLDLVPGAVRESALAMLDWADRLTGNPERDALHRAATVNHLHVMVDHIQRAQDSAARVVRQHDWVAARLIQERDRAERGRIALLVGIDKIERTIDRTELKLTADMPADWPTLMRGATTRALTDHEEAWR